MSSSEPGKVIASAFALAGFAVAMIAGIASGNPSAVVLKVGIVAMLICYVAGACIGSIAQGVVSQHLEGSREGASGSPGASAARDG